MSERIRIKVQDFYRDAIGEEEYTYVTPEVYEALTQTFRREAHAEERNYFTGYKKNWQGEQP